jgi:hypothetical protein
MHFLQRQWKMRQWKQCLNKCVICTNGLFGRCLKMPSITQNFLGFNEFINFYMSQGLTLSGGIFIASHRAWTPTSIRHLLFSLQRSWGVSWFSKQSLWPYLSGDIWGRKDHEWQAIGHVVWGIDSQLLVSPPPPSFKCLSPGHSPNGFCDTVNCSYVCCMPGLMFTFSQSLFVLKQSICTR